jgi:hypothetical protein
MGKGFWNQARVLFLAPGLPTKSLELVCVPRCDAPGIFLGPEDTGDREFFLQ